MQYLTPHLLTRALFIGLLIVAGCDCESPDGTGGPCDSPIPNAECGRECDADNPCNSGYYCDSDGTCRSDCAGGIGCATGEVCGGDGRCRPAMQTDASVGQDGSTTVDAAVCANVELMATPITPNVVIIVDQSGSMNADFVGDQSRWDVLRESLLAQPDGLISSLESQVRFGLALYSGREGNPVCPLVTSVDLAIDNYAAIAAVYNAADPIADTPTGDAIDEVLAQVMALPNPAMDPTIFVVATDGEPDRCEELNPQRGQGEAVAAVENAFAAGVSTYIISVGEGNVSAQHLQDMANAGLGRMATDPDAEFWVAGDEQGLAAALGEIVGGVLTCDVNLEGRIDVTTACSGSVRLNGRTLDCNDPNGWAPLSEDRIEILGTACEELQSSSGAVLEATFPCDVVLI